MIKQIFRIIWSIVIIIIVIMSIGYICYGEGYNNGRKEGTRLIFSGTLDKIAVDNNDRINGTYRNDYIFKEMDNGFTGYYEIYILPEGYKCGNQMP